MSTTTRTRGAFGFWPRRGVRLDPGRSRRARGRRFALVTAIALALLAGAGLALAYFGGSGRGSGRAVTATATAVTLSPAAASAGLYPGGTAAVALSAANPNLVAVRFGSLSLDTTQGTAGFSVDAGHSGCAVSVLSYTTQTNGGSGWTVPAKVGAVNGTLSITLANAVAMSSSAANACQGATFTVYLTAGP